MVEERQDRNQLCTCLLHQRLSTCSTQALPHPNAMTRWTIHTTRARYYGDALFYILPLISVATTTHTVSLQSPPQLDAEDRPLVEDWKLSNEKWKSIGVFDGAITHVCIRARC